jgi:hypothetical protein
MSPPSREEQEQAALDDVRLVLHTPNAAIRFELQYVTGGWALKLEARRRDMDIRRSMRWSSHPGRHFLGRLISAMYTYDDRDGGNTIAPMNNDGSWRGVQPSAMWRHPNCGRSS